MDIKGKPQPHLLPQHIRKIYVNEIQIEPKVLAEKGHIMIEPKFRLELRNQFIADGRVAVYDKKEDSDGFLDISIVRYLIETLSYDSNHIAEKQKLWVLADIRFTDTVTNEVLWVEKRLSSDIIFNLASTSAAEVSTENDAAEYIIRDMSLKILKRTIDGWFASSGISEKQ